MLFVRSGKSTLVTLVATFVSILLVIFVYAYSTYAQLPLKIIANPPAVTASKPTDVTVHVTKADDKPIDQTAADQIGSVKLGDATIPIKSLENATGTLTFTAPADIAGMQKLELLDKSNPPKILGETQLQFPGQSSGAAAQTSPATEARQNKLADSWWYKLSILLLFGFMLVMFVWLICRVINRSRSSFRNPTGFPVGSFRTILAFILVSLLGFFVLASTLSFSEFKPPEALLGIIATVIGFYFGSRSDESGGDASAGGIVRGVVMAGPVPARGAMVKFRRDDGTEPYIRVTDVDGRFAPVTAKPGKYTVHASLTGMPEGVVQLTAAEGSDQEIVIVLKPVVTSP